jgi:hypothetical protein
MCMCMQSLACSIYICNVMHMNLQLTLNRCAMHRGSLNSFVSYRRIYIKAI